MKRVWVILFVGLWGMGSVGQTTNSALVVQDNGDAVTAMSTLEKRIVLQKARIDSNLKEFTSVDARIEAELVDLLTQLNAVKDSAASGGRISKLKTDVIAGLKKNIQFLKNERSRRMADWRQYSSGISKEALEKQVLAIEAKIDKRLEQITQLQQSMPSSGVVSGGSSTDPDQRQEQSDSRRTEALERTLTAEVKTAIGKLEVEKRGLEARLKTMKDADQREFLEAEIEVIENRIEDHESRLEEMSMDGTTDAQALSRQDAFQMDQMMRESFRDLKKDWGQIVHLAFERNQLLMHLKAMQSQRGLNTHQTVPAAQADAGS